MAVEKEWTCSNLKCQHEFDSVIDICPRCASAATRAFRTPVGVTTNKGKPAGKAKTLDRILEREFEKQGIADFTNVGGENKVRWKSRVQSRFPGVYATPMNGAPPQAPIQASLSKPGDFTPIQQQYGADPRSFNVEGVPYSLQSDNSFEGMAPQPSQARVGRHRPEKLMRQTEVIHHPEGDPKLDQRAVDEVLRKSA